MAAFRVLESRYRVKTKRGKRTRFAEEYLVVVYLSEEERPFEATVRHWMEQYADNLLPADWYDEQHGSAFVYKSGTTPFERVDVRAEPFGIVVGYHFIVRGSGVELEESFQVADIRFRLGRLVEKVSGRERLEEQMFRIVESFNQRALARARVKHASSKFWLRRMRSRLSVDTKGKGRGRGSR